jgi:hypothetical protein
MDQIHIPEEWHDQALLTFEDFCTLIHTPNAPCATGADVESDLAGPGSKAADACTSR